MRKIFDLANKIKHPINLSVLAGEKIVDALDIPDSIKEEGIQWTRQASINTPLPVAFPY